MFNSYHAKDFEVVIRGVLPGAQRCKVTARRQIGVTWSGVVSGVKMTLQWQQYFDAMDTCREKTVHDWKNQNSDSLSQCYSVP